MLSPHNPVSLSLAGQGQLEQTGSNGSIINDKQSNSSYNHSHNTRRNSKRKSQGQPENQPTDEVSSEDILANNGQGQGSQRRSLGGAGGKKIKQNAIGQTQNFVINNNNSQTIDNNRPILGDLTNKHLTSSDNTKINNNIIIIQKNKNNELNKNDKDKLVDDINISNENKNNNNEWSLSKDLIDSSINQILIEPEGQINQGQLLINSKLSESDNIKIEKEKKTSLVPIKKNKNYLMAMSDDCLDMIAEYFNLFDLIQFTQTSKFFAQIFKINRFKSFIRLNHLTKEFKDLYCSFRSFKSREKNIFIDDYMTRQTEFSPNMRSILADWLIQVNNEFQNDNETIALAIRMADGYFSRTVIARANIQLVGIASLLLASKLIETHYPDLAELLYLCDGIYSRKQLLSMERAVMQKLHTQLQVPGVVSFSRILSQAMPLSSQGNFLVQYLSEASLLFYPYCLLSSSTVSVTIYCFVAFHEKLHSKIRDIIDFSGVSIENIAKAAMKIQELARDAHTIEQAHVRTRYGRDDRSNVSKLTFDYSDNSPFILYFKKFLNQENINTTVSQSDDNKAIAIVAAAPLKSSSK